MIGIYKITSPTGRIYIGQSWDIEKRFAVYKSSNSARHSDILDKSFKKYGVANHIFQIVTMFGKDATQEMLDNEEIKYIKMCRELMFDMMNIRGGGKGGKHSEQSKLKMKEAKKGKVKKIWTPESLAKRSASQKGLKRTELTKKRLSESKLGEKNPSYHKTPDFAKITHNQVREIRAYPKPLEKGMLTILAERYGVSRACISGIRSFVNFKHVE